MKTEIRQVPIDQIVPGNNDRTIFDEAELKELSDSIRDVGLTNPITLRLFTPDPRCVFGGDRWGDMAQYQIVAGERRFRAMKLLGWQEVPAIVRELTDNEASAVMLSENVSRSDLDPIDEANAYKYRIALLGWTVAECAEKAGVKQVRVQFRLKLLNLRDEIQQLVRTKNIGLGYAQILADARLDSNRQMLAVSKLRDNPKPTPGWFRNLVNEYAEKQNQAGMFEDAFLVCQEVPSGKLSTTEPPLPSTHKPDIRGADPMDTLKHHVAFWTKAAQEWAMIGKPFKKQECEAAVAALVSVYSSR